MPNTTRPAVPTPASDSSGGTAAITKITTPRNTIAQTVSSNALPRLMAKLFGSSRSCATWIPVTSAAIPPDALHKASTMAMSRVIETPAVFASMIEVSWNTRKSWTSWGAPTRRPRPVAPRRRGRRRARRSRRTRSAPARTPGTHRTRRQPRPASGCAHECVAAASSRPLEPPPNRTGPCPDHTASAAGVGSGQPVLSG